MSIKNKQEKVIFQLESNQIDIIDFSPIYPPPILF